MSCAGGSVIIVFVKRKVLIVLLSVAAISTAALGWTGYRSPIFRQVSVGDRFHFYICAADGLLRFYTFEAEEPMYLRERGFSRYISVHRRSDDAMIIRFIHERPGLIPAFAIITDRHSSRLGTNLPTVYMRGVRMPVTLPTALLLVYPILVLGRIRIRRHRLKPGHCPTCAYNLRGNTSGICSECGATVRCPDCGCDLTGDLYATCPKCSVPIQLKDSA